MQDDQVTLAIETAIAAGSLALFRGDTLLSSHEGTTGVARAEALLAEIENLLLRANIQKSELSRIAISLGPGSFTGVRIGIATALGLKAALGIECRGISALAAVARGFNGPSVAAVPVGKADVAWQEFGVGETPPSSDSENIFLEFLARRPGIPILAHSFLIERLPMPSPNVHNIGSGIAACVGSAINAGLGSDQLEPIYLRNSRYSGVG